MRLYLIQTVSIAVFVGAATSALANERILKCQRSANNASYAQNAALQPDFYKIDDTAKLAKQWNDYLKIWKDLKVDRWSEDIIVLDKIEHDGRRFSSNGNLAYSWGTRYEIGRLDGSYAQFNQFYGSDGESITPEAAREIARLLPTTGVWDEVPFLRSSGTCEVTHRQL